MSQQLSQQLQAFLPMILLFVVFYLLIFRPQQKRQKEHQQLISSISPDDTVVTIGGVYGKVTKVKEKTVILRLADKVEVEFEKSAIARRVND